MDLKVRSEFLYKRGDLFIDGFSVGVLKATRVFGQNLLSKVVCDKEATVKSVVSNKLAMGRFLRLFY